MRTAFAPRTSPSGCAAVSASWSTSSAFAVASWTFITRPDLARDLRLDVVALVEHERDARARLERAALHALVHDPEQLEGVGRADHQVVVRVEARVEVEPAEPVQPQQRRDDELDVRARRVVAGVDDDLAPSSPSARQWTRAVPQSGHVGACRRPARRACTRARSAGRRRAGRRPSRRPRRGGPGGRGCRPGPGSSCRPRTTASGRATRWRP